MKNKFVLTEEESKRILSLHTQKIKEERTHLNEQEEDLDEVADKGQSVGRVAAGSGVGATAGAIIGCIAAAIPSGGLACPGGAAVGASIGTAVGGFVGSFTTGGGYYEKVLNALKWCNTNAKNVGTPVNSDSDIRDIADDIAGAVEGFGRTDEVMIARSIRKLKSIPDLCRLNQIYRSRNTESLLNALDGDIDVDGDWRDYVWRPIEELKNYSVKKSKDVILQNAKKCGYSSVGEYKKAGWKCPKGGGGGGGGKDLLQTAISCGWKTVEEYKNSGWKCKTGGGGGGGGGSKRYPFDYNTVLAAINKKCPGGGGGNKEGEEEDIVNPFGQGGEPQKEVITVTDNIYGGL